MTSTRVLYIYQNKVVGNSPELARGLDAHGFSDLEKSVQNHVSLTNGYDKDDPRKFEMSTPTKVSYLLLL